MRAGDRPKRPKKKSPAFKNGPDDKLWGLIERCWAPSPSARPDIFQVIKELDEMWPELKPELSGGSVDGMSDGETEMFFDAPEKFSDASDTFYNALEILDQVSDGGSELSL
ncbi:hypothetical protein SCHPADRAFT_942412 [Schizopora paradoxa]|uniref:Serine-threonine/tyrosine-protein kinase catalytic domain-containing protein n=1 Tax=Schizopora paradoxa TaxID=27342 RepID=A0A0H2RGQ4_9AGAM|nr:hypothetical protein SCHPADRAFT_942412 [Schizopora paradoxa]